MNEKIVPPLAWPAPERAALKLLHVFSTFAVGGPQRRFAAIANHFGAAFQHLVWPMDGCTDGEYLLAPGGSWKVIAQPFPKHSFLRNARAARRFIRQLRPDVLVTYNWGATEWAAGNIPRLVRHIHIEDGFGPEEAEGQIRRRVWFRRLILNRHSLVVLPSRTLVTLATNVWRLDPARAIYLPNGIPCARFGGAPNPVVTSTFRGTGPVVGTVATLRREKALGRLIEAFAVVRATRPCRLVIVGDGPAREELERHATRLGISEDVTFTGRLDRPEQVLGGFDVFAVSSDTEQMPLSILEAMAAGLAIATTDAGDIRDMVAMENRAYVVPKSTSDLATAIAALLDSPELRARLGAGNRARALAVFDEEAMLGAYERLFTEPPPA